MRYAVLGTGIVGRTLASGLLAAGHEVVIGTRDPDATLARSEHDAFGNPPYREWQAQHPQIGLVPFPEAGDFGASVVNATAGTVSLPALRAAGEGGALAGKVLVDVANPLDFSAGMPPSLDPVGTDSLAERIQRAFPDARVVKTLNTVNSQIMTDPARVPGDHEVFVCGDDPEARREVTGLLRSFGWPERSVVDLGDLTAARGPEMYLPLWLRTMGALGTGLFNVKVVR